MELKEIITEIKTHGEHMTSSDLAYKQYLLTCFYKDIADEASTIEIFRAVELVKIRKSEGVKSQAESERLFEATEPGKKLIILKVKTY